MEHNSIDKTVVIIPSRELNLARRILDIAILVEEGNIDKIRELYDKEVESHGNEANAICCLKVDYYIHAQLAFDSCIFTQKCILKF